MFFFLLRGGAQTNGSVTHRRSLPLGVATLRVQTAENTNDALQGDGRPSCSKRAVTGVDSFPHAHNTCLAKKLLCYAVVGPLRALIDRSGTPKQPLKQPLPRRQVLRTAGKTKRDNPDKAEAFLMYRTLRDMNLSKLVAQDVPLFLSLLADLFPSTPAPPKGEYPEIEAALKVKTNSIHTSDGGLFTVGCG